MQYLLIPSRHILYSKEQYDALLNHLKKNSYEKVILAITSSDLNNCKYSSIDIFYRTLMASTLAGHLLRECNATCVITTVPHTRKTDSYASYVVKHVFWKIGLTLTPENTRVFSYGKYMSESFSSASYDTVSCFVKDHVHLFEKLFREGDSEYFWSMLSLPSEQVFSHQSELLGITKKIWLDPILKEMGSITETRNYHIYTHAMSNEQVIEYKYNDIKDYLVEGKIVDEGCADCALFIPVARDFPDSDLIGVEISSDFIARANERIREGFFGGSFVTVLQANLLFPIFQNESIDTVICNSTLHEIWSYNNKMESLKGYLTYKYNQLRKGGRLIARDVVGVEDPRKVVLLRDVTDNNTMWKKFLNDFDHVGDDVCEEVVVNGQVYAKTSYKLASEYLLHKDYQDNWQSEMHEEFCHMNSTSWKELLLSVGFTNVIVNAYQNSWIVENRFKGKVILLDESFREVAYPPTNVVIVAEK